MSRATGRTRRVGEQIQRELAFLLLKESGDPRLHAVTVSEVDVSPDFAQAKVYVTGPAASDVPATLKALNHAAGFLRHELGERLVLRRLPRLHFVWDETLESAMRLDALISAHVRPAPEED